MNHPFSFELFNRMPIVGIMRGIPDEYIRPIAAVYAASGLTCLEMTMNSSNAAQHISALVDEFGGRLNIGAGTVCSMADLETALSAKAQFIVTPVINDDVIKTCVEVKVPIFPGAYTPSEIYKAWTLGATAVKLFPSGDLKPAYIKEVLAPLNFVKLMPTGGVKLDNLTTFFEQGASAVGIGSHFFPKEVLARQDWDALGDIYRAFAEKYSTFAKGL